MNNNYFIAKLLIIAGILTSLGCSREPLNPSIQPDFPFPSPKALNSQSMRSCLGFYSMEINTKD